MGWLLGKPFPPVFVILLKELKSLWADLSMVHPKNKIRNHKSLGDYFWQKWIWKEILIASLYFGCGLFHQLQVNKLGHRHPVCSVYVCIGLSFKEFFYTADTNMVTGQMRKDNLLSCPGNLGNVHTGTPDFGEAAGPTSGTQLVPRRFCGCFLHPHKYLASFIQKHFKRRVPSSPVCQVVQILGVWAEMMSIRPPEAWHMAQT